MRIRHTLRIPLLLALLGLSLALLGSCGGGSGTPDFPKVVDLGKGDVFPSIANSTLAAGENRVSMGLIDRDDNAILDAKVHVRYYNLNGKKPKFRSQADARFIRADLSYIDEQSRHEKTPAGTSGVYVTYADFDEAGDWGAEITVTRDGKKLKPLLFRFNVLEHSIEPGIGDPAPPSVQPTLATAPDIEDIDSSYPPRPSMHDTTVADALKTGKPVVVAFATPAYCQSRTCGPVMDTVMDPLSRKYAGEAIFIHIEPYVLRDLRQSNVQTPVRATEEWRLQSEPWVFVVDRQGRIAARFEGITAEDEVDAALSIMLETAPDAVTPAP